MDTAVMCWSLDAALATLSSKLQAEAAQRESPEAEASSQIMDPMTPLPEESTANADYLDVWRGYIDEKNITFTNN